MSKAEHEVRPTWSIDLLGKPVVEESYLLPAISANTAWKPLYWHCVVVEKVMERRCKDNRPGIAVGEATVVHFAHSEGLGMHGLACLAACVTEKSHWLVERTTEEITLHQRDGFDDRAFL